MPSPDDMSIVICAGSGEEMLPGSVARRGGPGELDNCFRPETLDECGLKR